MIDFETVMTLLSAIFALVLVLAFAYVTLKWMGSKMSSQGSSRVIKVIDRVAIGQDKCLLVVRVGEQKLLVGMSGDAVVKLAELPELDEAAIAEAAAATPEFSEVLRDAVSTGWNKLTKKGDDAQ